MVNHAVVFEGVVAKHQRVYRVFQSIVVGCLGGVTKVHAWWCDGVLVGNAMRKTFQWFVKIGRVVLEVAIELWAVFDYVATWANKVEVAVFVQLILAV